MFSWLGSKVWVESLSLAGPQRVGPTAMVAVLFILQVLYPAAPGLR